MCICLLGLREGEKGKIMRSCHPFNTDGQKEHSWCKGEKEGSSGGWACVQLECNSCQRTWLFLRGVPCQWWLLHATQGWSTEWETVFWCRQWDYESKQKNEGLPNCAKGGEKGLKMLNWRKEKVVNSKKWKKTNQMLDRQIFCNLV